MDPEIKTEEPTIVDEKFTINLENKENPMCCIVIGMAGSGKTTFISVRKISLNNSQ